MNPAGRLRRGDRAPLTWPLTGAQHSCESTASVPILKFA